MKKLAELKKQREAAKADALKLLNLAEGEGRDLNAEEEAQYSGFEATIKELTGEIDAAENLADRRRTMDALLPAGSNVVHDPNPATTNGFKGMGEFASAVVASTRPGGEFDRRLLGAVSDVHQGGAASGEGFEVPTEFRDEIFDVVGELDEFGSMVDEEPTSKRKVEGVRDETTPWGAGGIQANWRSEGTKMDASKLNTDPMTIVLHELYAFILATEELLEDGPRLQSRLTQKAGQAIAWKKNAAMVYGTGAGQPLGWMNSAALVTVPKESGQSADTIQTENVLNMFSRLLRVPGDKPRWLANSDTLPQLMTMKIGDQPIWMPPNGLVSAPGGMLMGLPVDLTEHAKTLGDKGDLQLLSPKGYYALKRTDGPKFAQSIHLYFDHAIEAFRWQFRFGGQPHLSKPVAPAHGSTTKSHFVALAERA